MKIGQFIKISQEAEGTRIEMDCNGQFLGAGVTKLLLTIYRENPEIVATIMEVLLQQIEEEDKARKEMQKQLEEVLKNGF